MNREPIVIKESKKTIENMNNHYKNMKSNGTNTQSMETATKVLRVAKIATGVVGIINLVVPDALPLVDEALIFAAYGQIHKAQNIIERKKAGEEIDVRGLAGIIADQAINIAATLDETKSKNKSI